MYTYQSLLIFYNELYLHLLSKTAWNLMLIQNAAIYLQFVLITIVIFSRIIGTVQNACFDFFYSMFWQQRTCITTAVTLINAYNGIFLGETAISVSTLQDRRMKVRKCWFSIAVPILWDRLEARLALLLTAFQKRTILGEAFTDWLLTTYIFGPYVIWDWGLFFVFVCFYFVSVNIASLERYYSYYHRVYIFALFPLGVQKIRQQANACLLHRPTISGLQESK